MSILSLIIPIAIIVVFLALIIFLLAKQYRKVGPNEILIVAGGRKRTVVLPDGRRIKIGYRYRLGGGAFVIPFIETVYTLPVDVITLNIKTPEVLTFNGVPIMAEATAQIRIDTTDEAIRLAAEQFLGQGKEGIRDVAATILEGKMREVIGRMTVEEIYRGRQEFANRVKEAAKEDFSQMGLVMISFALKDISDSQGYLEALSRPQIAAARRDAAIAQAETEKEAIIKSSEARKEAEIARLAAEALIAKAQWENEAKKAESQVMVNQKKAQADFAYELERHKLSQEIKKEEARVKQIEKQEAIKIEELEITRRQKELEASVIKPADARKYQIMAEAEAEEYRIQAEAKGKAEALRLEGQVEAESIRLKGMAEAEAMLQRAKAWERLNQAALIEMYFKILPELARAVAEPLSKIDKIIIVGGDRGSGATRITAQVAEVLAQMPEVIKSLTGIDLQKWLKERLAPEEKSETEKSES